MTDIAAHTATPRVLERAGGRPTTVVAGLLSRRAGRSGALWGLVFGFYVAASALGYASLYTTHAAREQLAQSFGSSIGITALVGPARAIDTVAGFTVWRSLGVLSLLGAVWGLLSATRLMRGEEEAGHVDALAGQRKLRPHGVPGVERSGSGELRLSQRPRRWEAGGQRAGPERQAGAHQEVPPVHVSPPA